MPTNPHDRFLIAVLGFLSIATPDAILYHAETCLSCLLL